MQIQEILSSLDLSEKKKLYDLLKKDMGFIPELDKIKKDLNKDQKVLCPHCLSADIFGHGSYKGRKRYKCKQCKKTFNDFTGTAISGIKTEMDYLVIGNYLFDKKQQQELKNDSNWKEEFKLD